MLSRTSAWRCTTRFASFFRWTIGPQLNREHGSSGPCSQGKASRQTVSGWSRASRGDGNANLGELTCDAVGLFCRCTIGMSPLTHGEPSRRFWSWRTRGRLDPAMRSSASASGRVDGRACGSQRSRCSSPRHAACGGSGCGRPMDYTRSRSASPLRQPRLDIGHRLLADPEHILSACSMWARIARIKYDRPVNDMAGSYQFVRRPARTTTAATSSCRTVNRRAHPFSGTLK